MNDKGYTIIELLISTAILSFLIMGMVIMLLQQQRQFNFTKEISDIDTTGRTLLNFIASEIRNSGARQGKAFSLKFINGGSDPGNLCIKTSTQVLIPNNNAGTVDSPPDCIALYTWDLTAGMTTINDAGDPELNLPSTTETTLSFTNNTNTLLIDLICGGECPCDPFSVISDDSATETVDNPQRICTAIDNENYK